MQIIYLFQNMFYSGKHEGQTRNICYLLQEYPWEEEVFHSQGEKDLHETLLSFLFPPALSKYCVKVIGVGLERFACKQLHFLFCRA